MSEFKAVSKVLATARDGYLSFFCPGCGSPHVISIGGGSGHKWWFNGNIDAPTFSPSIMVTWPANPNATDEFKEWRSVRVCHSFVTDGRIQYLNDCTHHLAGKTIDIPDWEKSFEEW